MGESSEEDKLYKGTKERKKKLFCPSSVMVYELVT
jgi:hypothetical protein